MRIAHDPAELPPARRAAYVDSFDGVHVGHRAVLAAARHTGRPVVMAVVVAPAARGSRLLTTLDRRLELLADAGADEALVLPAPPRSGVLAALNAVEVHTEGPPNVSSDEIRDELEAGRVEAAAALLGRPPEVEGTVVAGDARGAGLGFPTANLDVPPELLVPRLGIYAGAAAGHRAAISIGTNPTYGSGELRVEAFLLDYAGDLYGRRLVVELWRYLREERAFAGEQELVAQIARDVEETREAARPG